MLVQFAVKKTRPKQAARSDPLSEEKMREAADPRHGEQQHAATKMPPGSPDTIDRTADIDHGRRSTKRDEPRKNTVPKNHRPASSARIMRTSTPRAVSDAFCAKKTFSEPASPARVPTGCRPAACSDRSCSRPSAADRSRGASRATPSGLRRNGELWCDKIKREKVRTRKPVGSTT